MRQLPERFFLIFLLFLSLPFFESGGSLRPEQGYEFRREYRSGEFHSILIPEIEEEKEAEQDGEEEGHSVDLSSDFSLHQDFTWFFSSYFDLAGNLFFRFVPSGGRSCLFLFCVLRI